MAVVILGDLEAGILSQPTGKFPEGAHYPRLIDIMSLIPPEGNRALPST
jgi:hypothetical protein